jgi:hypothetical protein
MFLLGNKLPVLGKNFPFGERLRIGSQAPILGGLAEDHTTRSGVHFVHVLPLYGCPAQEIAMDNRLNETRRKISFLRSEMLVTEDIIRKQINRDEDCTEAALRLMAMRTTMLGLIGERDSLGGGERLLDVEERLKAEYCAVSRKPLKGALGRRER